MAQFSILGILLHTTLLKAASNTCSNITANLLRLPPGLLKVPCQLSSSHSTCQRHQQPPGPPTHPTVHWQVLAAAGPAETLNRLLLLWRLLLLLPKMLLVVVVVAVCCWVGVGTAHVRGLVEEREVCWGAAADVVAAGSGDACCRWIGVCMLGMWAVATAGWTAVASGATAAASQLLLATRHPGLIETELTEFLNQTKGAATVTLRADREYECTVIRSS